MKANELMIGDLFLHKGQPIKVEEILIDGINPMWDGSENYGNEAYYEDLRPIPLTPEILEKNGFNKLTEPPYITYYELGLNEYMNKVLWYKGSIVIDYEGDNVYLCDCEYVHELQHALKLCGIEKEIVL